MELEPAYINVCREIDSHGLVWFEREFAEFLRLFKNETVGCIVGINRVGYTFFVNAAKRKLSDSNVVMQKNGYEYPIDNVLPGIYYRHRMPSAGVMLDVNGGGGFDMIVGASILLGLKTVNGSLHSTHPQFSY